MRAAVLPHTPAMLEIEEIQIDTPGPHEVLVRTDAVMQGYAGDPAGTAAAFDGAWLRTGDLGHIDTDGSLFITGRIKEAMVTSAGETIYPDEIEPNYRSPLFAELADMWIPLTGEARDRLQISRGTAVAMIGQRKDGASLSQAQAELATLWAQLQQARPDLRQQFRVRLVDYSATAGGNSIVATRGNRMLAVFSGFLGSGRRSPSSASVRPSSHSSARAIWWRSSANASSTASCVAITSLKPASPSS